ncbi:MAG: hypothetical protein WA085_03380 [Sphingobium sp.]|uniref:hypothetical protein n=1 Tax=Sphingobium sp. CECT 9361 TaxID=2845384 RepID=UPI001E40C953|nr:hypothetical protein [Sphingobium sp. CECT 9361]CAH0353705.1 hypothetical protein SPH9361_02559 [Sphingobium sp. CECT 9361]
MSTRRDIVRATRKRRLMTLFAGCAAALAMLSVPIPLIELVVASTGLSETIPAAAPPLGFTARVAMAGFAALLGMGVSLALNPRVAAQDDEEEAEQAGLNDWLNTESETKESKMGFALSKLTSFTRGRGRAVDRERAGSDLADPLPVLRRADSHPDAPARRPIFASRDFEGADIFALSPARETAAVADVHDALDMSSGMFVDDVAEAIVAQPEPAAAKFDAPDGLVMPNAPEPLDDRAILTEAINALPQDAAVEAQPIIARVPLDTLSIAELADRFERGIARRRALAQAAAAAQKIETIRAETAGISTTQVANEPRVLADIPPVPRVAVRGDVDAEVDQALRDALGTLQQMTGR